MEHAYLPVNLIGEGLGGFRGNFNMKQAKTAHLSR